MSLSSQFAASQKSNNALDLAGISENVASEMQKDVEFLAEKLSGKNRLRNIFRGTRGIHDKEFHTLTYVMARHDVPPQPPTHDGVGYALAVVDKKRLEYDQMARSEDILALHKLCADPKNNFRLEIASGEYNRGVTGMSTQLSAELLATIHLSQPYSASSYKPEGAVVPAAAAAAPAANPFKGGPGA